jgi:hypothetical protein
MEPAFLRRYRYADRARRDVVLSRDKAIAGPEHPIRVVRDPLTGEPSPYVLIRRNLEALIDRKSFYRLVELGQTEKVQGEDWFGVRSGGDFFPIIPAAELTA